MNTSILNKEWFTLNDAAQYLSDALGSSFKVVDILELAITKKITLTANLLNPTPATRVLKIPYKVARIRVNIVKDNKIVKVFKDQYLLDWMKEIIKANNLHLYPFDPSIIEIKKALLDKWRLADSSLDLDEEKIHLNNDGYELTTELEGVKLSDGEDVFQDDLFIASRPLIENIDGMFNVLIEGASKVSLSNTVQEYYGLDNKQDIQEKDFYYISSKNDDHAIKDPELFPETSNLIIRSSEVNRFIENNTNNTQNTLEKTIESLTQENEKLRTQISKLNSNKEQSFGADYPLCQREKAVLQLLKGDHTSAAPELTDSLILWHELTERRADDKNVNGNKPEVISFLDKRYPLNSGNHGARLIERMAFIIGDKKSKSK